MQQVQTNKFRSVPLNSEVDCADSAKRPSAPVELSLEVLGQVGGGLTPNDNWATAATPNDNW